MNKTGMKLPIFESSNKQLMTIKGKTWPHGTNSHLPLDVYVKLNLSINSSWRCTGHTCWIIPCFLRSWKLMSSLSKDNFYPWIGKALADETIISNLF